MHVVLGGTLMSGRSDSMSSPSGYGKSPPADVTNKNGTKCPGMFWISNTVNSDFGVINNLKQEQCCHEEDQTVHEFCWAKAIVASPVPRVVIVRSTDTPLERLVVCLIIIFNLPALNVGNFLSSADLKMDRRACCVVVEMYPLKSGVSLSSFWRVSMEVKLSFEASCSI